MGVTHAVRLIRHRSDAERWSFLALLLAVVGLSVSIWFIFSSQSETSQIRWWLVALPLVVTAAPVLVPRHGVRVAAAVLLGVWCFLTGFSIGMLLLPALLAALAAVVREG
jgi:hypothetical protein